LDHKKITEGVLQHPFRYFYGDGIMQAFNLVYQYTKEEVI